MKLGWSTISRARFSHQLDAKSIRIPTSLIKELTKPFVLLVPAFV